MYHEPTAAPINTKIKIGMKTAAVLLPPAVCVWPRYFSQFLPLKSVPQSQSKSPSVDSLQKPPFWHVQTLGRALGLSATEMDVKLVWLCVCGLFTYDVMGFRKLFLICPPTFQIFLKFCKKN